jgi:hypothetical protein
MPKKGRKIYLAGFFVTTAVAEVVDQERGVIFKSSVPLQWADGQIGAIAVFSNKKKAQKYAGSEKVLTMVDAGEID